MATELKLKEDIKKLEAGIKSKATPEKIKGKLKNQLAILNAELSALQKPAASKMSRAKQLRAKYKALYGVRFQGIDIEKDADIPARAIGKRTSKGLKGNQYVSKAQAKGHTYYEYRENRVDMKQPPKKYPKLEDGGYIAKGGNLPSSLQKRLDNLKGRVNITKSKALEAYEMHNDKGMGGSSVGYELFKAENKRDSQTFGDLAIDLGRYYSGKKADKTEDAKLLDSKEHGGYMAKGGNLIGKQKNLDVNKNGKLDSEDFKMLRGDKMAKGGIYSSDDRWVVTFENQDSGEFEEVTVRANSKSNAIATAEDESGLSDVYQYYSVKKSMAHGGMMAKGGNTKAKKMADNSKLVRFANTDKQLEVLNDIIPIFDEKGIQLSYGTSIGKSPQTIIFDKDYQDSILYISGDGWEGNCTYDGEDFSSKSVLKDIIENPEEYAKGGESKSSKVNFYDIVDSIKYLEYDGDPSDLRLFSDERFNWGADNPEDYEKAEKEIDNIKYKGNGWEIYATYDGSSYSYWMENQEEQNYISIVILFQKEKIDKSEIEKIKEALQDAHDDAENIADKYDYNPSNYAKGGKTQGYDDREDERLAMKYGKIKSKYLNSTKARRDDARFEERGKMADGGMMADGGEIGDSVIVELNNGKKIEGKIEKLNPFKIRTSPSSTEVIPNPYIKSVKKSMADGGMMAKGGVIGKYELTPYIQGVGETYNPKYQAKEYFEGTKNDAIEKANSMLNSEISMVQVYMVNPKATNVLNRRKKIATVVYEDGGMMAKGGKLSKKSFFKQYEENEDQNMHSENVVLLAKNYGTESDIRDAKTILAKHESIGNLPASLREERDALHKKLYDKFLQSKEDGGMMAEGGEVNGDNMEMVVSQVKAIKHHAEELSKIITSSTPIEAWVVAKIERSETDLSDVTHYLDGLKMEHGGRVSSSQHRLNR